MFVYADNAATTSVSKTALDAMLPFLTEQYEAHASQQHFVAALNKFYNERPALWQRAYTSDGFEWVNANDADQSIISFVRHGDDPTDDLVILINFDPATYEEFRIGLPRAGLWKEVFNTDAEEFGGSGVTNSGTVYESLPEDCDGRDNSVIIRVPPIGGVVLAYEGPLPKKEKAAKAPATKKETVTKKAPRKAAAGKKAPAAPKATAKKAAAKSTPTAKKRSKKA